MATEKQIEANRLNAQKCTGPITPEGKAISSQNALKTGLNAKSDVIATESREDYETLIAEYYQRYNPAMPEERCLVDDLITAEWLRRRYTAASAAIWEYEFRTTNELDMGLMFLRASQVFGRAQRCLTTTRRDFAHALKQLHALRAKRQAENPPLAIIANETLSPKLVSFYNDSEPPAQIPVPHPQPEEKPPKAA